MIKYVVGSTHEDRGASICAARCASRGEIVASRFWSLQTQSTVGQLRARIDPLVDVGLTVFAVDDGVEYPRWRQAIPTARSASIRHV